MLEVREQDFLEQRMYTRQDNQSGQASIEFILVFAFAIGITFLFLSLAINSTQGYLAQYANYMASRTFLSFDRSSNAGHAGNIDEAARVAREVFQSYPLRAFDINAEFSVLKPLDGAASSLYSGTTVKFSKRLTPFRLVGGGAMLNMYTESFLSKEPVRFSCWVGTCSGIGQGQCNYGDDITLYDNGC